MRFLLMLRRNFTDADVVKALKSYGNEDLIRWRLEMISGMTGIELKRVKRNKRKLNVHLGVL
jgi:hypothetical protein